MRDLIKELGRRSVLRVSVGYVVVAWLTAQVAELTLIQSYSTLDPLRQDPPYEAFQEKMGMRSWYR